MNKKLGLFSTAAAAAARDNIIGTMCTTIEETILKFCRGPNRKLLQNLMKNVGYFLSLASYNFFCEPRGYPGVDSSRGPIRMQNARAWRDAV